MAKSRGQGEVEGQSGSSARTFKPVAMPLQGQREVELGSRPVGTRAESRCMVGMWEEGAPGQGLLAGSGS